LHEDVKMKIAKYATVKTKKIFNVHMKAGISDPFSKVTKYKFERQTYSA